jgi:hypothetical protein
LAVPHLAIYTLCINGALGLIDIASTVYLLLPAERLSKAFVTVEMILNLCSCIPCMYRVFFDSASTLYFFDSVSISRISEYVFTYDSIVAKYRSQMKTQTNDIRCLISSQIYTGEI